MDEDFEGRKERKEKEKGASRTSIRKSCSADSKIKIQKREEKEKKS